MKRLALIGALLTSGAAAAQGLGGPGLATGSFTARILAPGATGTDLTLSGNLNLGASGANSGQLCLNATCTTYIWRSGANTMEFVNGGSALLTTSAADGIIRAPTTNPGFLSAAASGSNAFAATTNGARIDFGGGASDYASSDGTTVTFAGPVTVTGAITSGGGTSSIPTLSTNTLSLGVNGQIQAARAVWYNTVPTISSGFGTSPSIVNSNGTATFQINVGTGGTAFSGVIGFPNTTLNNWVCSCADITTPGANITRMTANSTSSCTVTNVAMSTGANAAWTASDKLWCTASAE